MRPASRMGLASVVFIAVYGFVLLVNGPFNSELIFPFHRWELFSKVPPAVNRSFSIRLVEVDGKPVDPPVYFDEARGLVDQPNSPVASQLMSDLGWGLKTNNLRRAVGAQMQLESRFMQGIDTARYEVVLRTFSVLERRACDCFMSEEVVATLEKAPPR